ncbi:MAG: hypothetical protein RG741_05450 [Bacteroidales bacterium]|nr:hypothetical protein [Bacteroidales bacterium]
MKTRSLLFVLAGLLVFFFTSCEKDEPHFEEELLIGKWRSQTLFYRYDSDYTGATWDTADDVSEEEAQKFEWTLIKADLTHIHIMEMGANVPKYYTVTELTETTLKYKDEFGKNFSFVKVIDD